MRILIDECIDERLRLLFPTHDCQTARFAKAEEAGFDVLITVDQNLPDQQNMSGRKIALVILRGSTNRLRDLTLLAPAAISAINSIAAGDVVRIG